MICLKFKQRDTVNCTPHNPKKPIESIALISKTKAQMYFFISILKDKGGIIFTLSTKLTFCNNGNVIRNMDISYYNKSLITNEFMFHF